MCCLETTSQDLLSLEISINLSEMPVRELDRPACSPGTVAGDIKLEGSWRR